MVDTGNWFRFVINLPNFGITNFLEPWEGGGSREGAIEVREKFASSSQVSMFMQKFHRGTFNIILIVKVYYELLKIYAAHH